MKAQMPGGWHRRFPPLSLPIVSLLIASLSMISSISQSFNYSRNIESVQKNVLRAENLRSCKEIIEVFFDFRLRAETANAETATLAPEARSMPGRLAMTQAMRRELKSLVYRFGALGTHLANFTPETARERYSALSWQLHALAESFDTLSPSDFMTQFALADTGFGALNEDCSRFAQSMR